MKNPLLDKQFLYELNQFQHKDIYARIIVLNFDEMPLEQIEGRITGGSINIDGNSAVRRTCNLSLVAKDVNINNFYWSIGSKFTLEIGLNNIINNEYPDIIWFKQGIFVIGSFNSSLSGNNYSISIGGKDKMCLLNGDIGGSLPASIDFGKIDTYNNFYKPVSFNVEDYTQYEANKYYTYDKDKKTDREKDKYEISIDKFDFEQEYYEKESILTQEVLTIENIIREAVHTYGKEPYSNIIINDLSDYGLELMEYRGDETLYLLYNEKAEIYDQMITESNASEITVQAEDGNLYQINKLPIFNSAVNNFNDNRTKFTFVENGNKYSATKIKSGDTTGYRPTDLVYAGELISSIGESLTSILDKIKNMLGAFEYFYDIDGRFIFQAKKTYAQNSWNTLQEYNGTVYARDAVDESPYSYSFEDVNLIQKFSNQPALNNLKNDYSIWGVRKSATGAEIPIHSRYAIHKKPTYYKNFDGQIFCSKEFIEPVDGIKHVVDWREIIYQMSLDYFKYNQDVDFAYKLSNNNILPDKSASYYPNGITEYEMFYTDIQGFWRQLYNYNLVLSSKYELVNGIKKFNDSDLDRLDQINKLNLELAQPGLSIDKQQEILKNISEIKKQMEYITYEIDQGEYINQVFYEITDLKQQIIDDLKISEKIEQQEYFFTYIEKDDDPNIEETDYRKKEFIPLLNSDIKAGNNYTYFTNSISIRDDNNNLKEKKDQRWQQGVWWKKHKWIGEPISDYVLPSEEEDESLWYWNRNVVEAPELLNFWIDFYDIESEIGQYGISIIGDRPKVVNNSKITSIYFRNVPQVIFIYDDTINLDRKTGYTYIQLGPGMEDLFTISSQGKSAEEETNELFNKHSYCNETINITTIPIYNLDTNTLIYIHNDENNINGKYEVSKITVPLTYNSTMSISATKIIDPII